MPLRDATLYILKDDAGVSVSMRDGFAGNWRKAINLAQGDSVVIRRDGVTLGTFLAGVDGAQVAAPPTPIQGLDLGDDELWTILAATMNHKKDLQTERKEHVDQHDTLAVQECTDDIVLCDKVIKLVKAELAKGLTDR